MADNNNKMSPKDRARYNYEHKKEFDKLYTSKDRAKDNYKIHKEYKKLEKRERLPGFIITVIVFVLFVGIFTGLYSQYDYELELKPKEFTEINIAESSEVLSAQLENSFVDFFIVLDDISDLALSSTEFLSTRHSYSDNLDVDVFLKKLRSDSVRYLKDNYGFFKRLILKNDLGYYLDAYGDPYVSYLTNNFAAGEIHVNYVHNRDLVVTAATYGWDAEYIHNVFVRFNICHLYNGELYKFCDIDY